MKEIWIKFSKEDLLELFKLLRKLEKCDLSEDIKVIIYEIQSILF